MKFAFIFPAAISCLLAGCASHQPAPPAAVAVTAPARRNFENTDSFKIETAVYGYLLEKHPWGDQPYAAIFLGGNEDRAAAMIEKLPKSALPLKPASRANLRPNQAPIDADTGKPALLVTARALGPTNGVSEAVGTWYGGGDDSGLLAFVLIEADGRWTIQSAK